MATSTNLLHVLEQKRKLPILNAKIINVNPRCNPNNIIFAFIHIISNIRLIFNIEIFMWN